jgi:hypothetical protein
MGNSESSEARFMPNIEYDTAPASSVRPHNGGIRMDRDPPPCITPEAADHNKARNQRGAHLPCSQATTTECVPGTTYIDVTPTVALDTFFTSQDPIPLELKPKKLDGVINSISIVLDVTVVGGPIGFAATPFWTTKKTIYQDRGDQTDLISMYPETELLWLKTCVKTDDLYATLRQFHFNTNPGNYLGQADLSYPGKHRFYIQFPQSFINQINIYNQLMQVSTIFELYTTNPIATNPSGTATFTLDRIGFKIETKILDNVLSNFDRRIVIEDFKRKPKIRYYLDDRPIPLKSAITITGTANSIDPIIIDTQNLGGRIIGYDITFRLAGATNTNNGYISKCVHVGDSATYDFMNGSESLINFGIPDTVDYLQHHILGQRCQASSDLLTRFPHSLFIPLTKSISAAFGGCPRGFQWTTNTDTFNIELVPGRYVAETQTFTKGNGAFPYTAGIWQYQDPVTMELSSVVRYNDAPAIHAAALNALKRAQQCGITFTVENGFVDNATTITITITAYQNNGFGGPIRIVPAGIVCNGVLEVPNISIATKGKRGFVPGMQLQTVIHALYLREILLEGGVFFSKPVGAPSYPNAEKAADLVLEARPLW